VVYRARHLTLNRIVAIKVLHGAAPGSRDTFERFRIEANAVARLEHPNIAPLYEAGRDTGAHFLVLRYFERGSLTAVLQTTSFTSEESARFIINVARAAHYAHQRGVLHRDLKPSNLLLDNEGQPYIADFGLAKLTDTDSSLTLSSSVLGTPNYMAPEQAEGRAKEASVAADIYSLGAILFELLAGRPPFVAETPLAVLRQVADEEPPRLRSLKPQIDRDLEAICLCCLEKGPDRRYPSAAALADDLERWLRNEPIAIRPITPVQRGMRWVRRRPLVASLIATTLLALVAGLAATTFQSRRARASSEYSQRLAYAADMALVQEVIEKDRPRAQWLLDQHRPRPGEEDLRNWEWRYFWQRLQPDKPLKMWQAKGRVDSLVSLDNGKYLAIGQAPGALRLMDVEFSRDIFESDLSANSGLSPYEPGGNLLSPRPTSIPGTSFLAWAETTEGTNCLIKIWDRTTRKAMHSLRQPYIVRHLVASPDGRRIVATCLTPHPQIVVWDWRKDHIENIFPARLSNFSRTHSLSISPDGRYITVDAPPRKVRVVDLETGADKLLLPLKDDYFLAAAFSPDGQLLAAYGGFDATEIQLWDMRTGELARTIRDSGSVSQILFSSDSQLLITAVADGTIRTCSVRSGEILSVRRAGNSPVLAIALSEDGKKVFSASQSGEIMLWDAENLPREQTDGRLPVAVRGQWQFMRGLWSFLPDSKGIVAVTTNSTIAKVSGAAWNEVQELRVRTNFTSVDALPDKTGFIAGAGNGEVASWQWDGSPKIRYGTVGAAVPWVRALPRSDRAVAIDTNGVAHVWNLGSGILVSQFSTDGLNGFGAFTADQRSLTVLFYDGRAVTFQLDSGHSVTNFLPNARPQSFIYSPDGRFAACASTEGESALYNATDLKKISRIGGGVSSFAAAFDSTSDRLILGGAREIGIHLWDIKTMREICSLKSDLDMTSQVAISPDGNVIAQSGVYDAGIHIWWVQSLAESSAQKEASPVEK
jgi:WD40 repeat protein